MAGPSVSGNTGTEQLGEAERCKEKTEESKVAEVYSIGSADETREKIAMLEEMILAEQVQVDRWRQCLIMMNEGLWNRVRRRDILIEWKETLETTMNASNV